MKSAKAGPLLRTGELARQARVNLQTIRYYERIGLLTQTPRLPSGYRIFSADAVRRVRFIKRAQTLGFNLREIRALLALDKQPRGRCVAVGRLARQHLAAVDARIGQLIRMRDALASLAGTCATDVDPTAGCPVLASLNDGERSHAD